MFIEWLLNEQDISRCAKGWTERQTKVPQFLPNCNNRIDTQCCKTRLSASSTMGQRFDSCSKRRRLLFGNDFKNSNMTWSFVYCDNDMELLLIPAKVINDLSSLLEDANITVSNLLTFSPDESDITDQLEILQVYNKTHFYRNVGTSTEIENFIYYWNSTAMPELLSDLLLHRWRCLFFVRWI